MGAEGDALRVGSSRSGGEADIYYCTLLMQFWCYTASQEEGESCMRLSLSRREYYPSFVIMSGFEIVGVVLGSIPLLISALEHYSEGVSSWKHPCMKCKKLTSHCGRFRQ